MRTYLTRLTMTAAGVVLTGVSLSGVAHADDELVFVDPSILEEVGNLEPCDEINASDEMALPVDPEELDELQLPTEPEDPETEKPWGDAELVPCYQIPADPEDDDGDDDGNDDDGQEPGNDDGDNGDDGDDQGGSGGQNGDGGNEPSGNGNTGGQGGGQGGGGSNGQVDGDPSDGVGDEGFGDADDETLQPEATVTPTAATGDDGNSALMLAIIAGALGALGLFLLTYGLRKRPRRGQQPA